MRISKYRNRHTQKKLVGMSGERVKNVKEKGGGGRSLKLMKRKFWMRSQGAAVRWEEDERDCSMTRVNGEGKEERRCGERKRAVRGVMEIRRDRQSRGRGY